MVRIRLRRTGLKNQPSYRIIAAEKESPRDGRFLEILGSYNPRTNPSTVEINEERVYDWISKGAQPSDSVVQIFNSVGLMDRIARFKAGESKDTLLAEAKVAYEKHAASGKAEKPVLEEKKSAAKKPPKEKAVEKVEKASASVIAEVLPVVESSPAIDKAEDAPEAITAPDAETTEVVPVPETATEAEKAKVASETEIPEALVVEEKAENSPVEEKTE